MRKKNDCWLIGGQLVSLIDLEACFGSISSANKKSQRVIVVDGEFSRIGLIVSKVYGLKSFTENDFSHDFEGDGLLPDCVESVVKSKSSNSLDKEIWYRFSIDKLFGLKNRAFQIV